MIKKFRYLVVAVTLLLTTAINAQVTTSGISGKVLDNTSAPIIGATIKATHTPTGTVYGASTRTNGSYNLSNLRIGGPYTIEISYIGYNKEVVSNITLSLGEEFQLNSVLKENSQALGEVVVVGNKSSIISSNRTGSQEIITRERMDKMPTLNRSLNDFTKLTPMNSGGNFGGTSYRFNNVTVDGASFNNSFGLSSALGASGTEPISLEALEQVQVMIAPFDVRNGAFTGAAINSVTKSGTNKWHGSAYMYTKSPSLTGYRQKGDINTISEFSNHQYGMSVSGPIIKNKLFFYLNGEMDRQETPINYKPRATKTASATGQYSIADAATLQQLSDFLVTKFNYNPGSYNVSNVPTKADRLTARVDWNINSKNTFSLKYFYLKSFNTNTPSTSGAPTNGRGPNSYAIPYSSTYYRTNNNFNIFMGDLTTTINDNMSNTLKLGYSALRDYREMDGGFFPQVDILDGGTLGSNNNAFTTFGTEANSYNNLLNSDIYQIQDNFTWILNNHQLTFGTQSDLRKFKNGYANSFAGSWKFNSVQDFYTDVNNYMAWQAAGSTGVKPTSLASSFSQKFALQGNGFPYAYVDVLTLGFYAQDKWTVTPNFNLTYGVRVDSPIFLTSLDANPAAAALTFQGGTKIDVAQYPKTKPLFSPRVGINWDVFSDKTLQVRGGSGIFTGTPPYVWLSNQAGNNGLLFGDISTKRLFDGIAEYTPTAAEVSSSRMDMAVTDPNFKYPQLWKSNLAADYKFGDGWIATVEMLYNKDVNAIYHSNIGLNDATVYVNDGSGQTNARPYFNPTNVSNGQYITTKTANVILMKNTSKGYSLYTTFQLQKTFTSGALKGLYFNGSYSFGQSKGVTDGSSSVASSAWKYRAALDPNAQELGYSAGSFDGRLLLQSSYTANWGKNSSTSFGVVYQIYQPFRYSYTYNGDLNGDGQNMNDLIFIPKDQSQINIVPASGDTRTAAQIWGQIDAFINQDPYLSKHRGEYSARNGAVSHYEQQLDANLSHDIKLPLANGEVHTLRFSFDIANVLNLLNKNWGVQSTTVLGNQQYQFLTMTTKPLSTNNYTPGFTMPLQSNNVLTSTFKDYNSSVSRWQIQFGVKYFF